MDILMFESFSAPKKLISLIALACLFIGAIAGLSYASVAHADEGMVILSDGSIALETGNYSVTDVDQSAGSSGMSEAGIFAGSSGTETQKLWSIAISSLALLSLVAYAIYTFVGYRREYEL